MYMVHETNAVVLNRRHFTWNKNPLSRKFRDCKNAEEFVAHFNAIQAELEVAGANGEAIEEDITRPPTKRPRVSGEPGAEERDMKKWLDKMDYEIEQHKIGIKLWQFLFVVHWAIPCIPLL